MLVEHEGESLEIVWACAQDKLLHSYDDLMVVVEGADWIRSRSAFVLIRKTYMIAKFA